MQLAAEAVNMHSLQNHVGMDNSEALLTSEPNEAFKRFSVCDAKNQENYTIQLPQNQFMGVTQSSKTVSRK